MSTPTPQKKKATPVPLARRARDLHESLAFQIWLVPFILIVPLTWIALLLEDGANSVSVVWLALALLASPVFAFVVAWGGPKVGRGLLALAHPILQRRRRATGTTRDGVAMGAEPPAPDQVTTLITWASYAPPRDGEPSPAAPNPFAKLENSAFPKLIRHLQPERLVLIVSTELAEEVRKIAPPATSPRETTIAWLRDQYGVLQDVHVVLGSSLSFPDAAALYTDCLDAVDYALNRCQAHEVIADVTGATVPASIALYEAAIERDIATTWWSQHHEEPVPIAALLPNRRAE